ncbi:hypothetical protein BH10ACI1_BH10ACI1_31810 [soil metagenome]
MKKTKRANSNFINALLAGFLVFGCSCTLCNKNYGSSSVSTEITSVWQKVFSGKSAKTLVEVENGRMK